LPSDVSGAQPGSCDLRSLPVPKGNVNPAADPDVLAWLLSSVPGGHTDS
jgi:hypothetical protein